MSPAVSRTARRIGLALLMLLVALAGLGHWLGTREPADPPARAAAAAPGTAHGPDESGQITRGRYLAALGNCMGCHTAARDPGQPSGRGALYAGGDVLVTPYGRFHAPNLTPDREHGLGNWTQDDFWRALRHGKRPDGSLLYPAFPYTSYRHLTRADADALFAYLQSLPAVPRPNIDHELSFPYSLRPLLAYWRALYFRADAPLPSAGDTEASPQWLRGRYLTEGLAHCAECHTARNPLGALRGDAPLGGAMMPGQGWYAPPLTGEPGTGLGNWAEQDIAELLRTGLSQHGFAAGPMAESVRNGFQHASEADAKAIAHYLKRLPAGPPPAPSAVPDYGVMAQGRKLYEGLCLQCHQAKGEGLMPAWPALVGNPGVLAKAPDNLIRLVLDGGFAPATPAHPRPHGMPPFGPTLSDADIAAVATYVRNSWGNSASPVTLPEVRRVRDRLR